MIKEQWDATWDYISDIPHIYKRYPDALESDKKTYWTAFKGLTAEEAIKLIDIERELDPKLIDELNKVTYYLGKANYIISKRELKRLKEQEKYDPTPEQRKKDVAAMFEFWETCIKHANTTGIDQSDQDGGFAHVSYPIGTFARREYDKMSK